MGSGLTAQLIIFDIWQSLDELVELGQEMLPDS